MSIFFKKSDYALLLKDISNIEFLNENIDSKTSAEKIILMRTLKTKIEDSGILKNNSDEPAQILIKSMYNLLYTKQNDFPESYYSTLSSALSNAESYLKLVRPYEMFLTQKISYLKDLASAASKTEEQKRMSTILNSKVGILKKAMIAIMIALSSISCSISYDKYITLSSTSANGIKIDYRLNVKDMENYTIKNGKRIKDSELGIPLTKAPGTFTLNNGQKEIGSILAYAFDNDLSPDLVVIRRADGSIINLMINKNSKSYDILKKKFGNRLAPYAL